MKYTLRYKRGAATNEQTEHNPSPEIIDFVIGELLPGVDHYIVLSSDKPVKNCDCVQTIIKGGDDKPVFEFLVEALLTTGDSFICHRIYINEIDEVKRLFRMFALGVIPDICDWDDVTEDVKRSIEKHKKAQTVRGGKRRKLTS